MEVEELEGRIAQVSGVISKAREEVGKALVGQTAMLDGLLIGLLADGHVLVEGVPGLAKTTAVNALAKALALDFARVQFTPDLLPADLIGTQIYQPASGTFSTSKGPIFANIVLADEINRAPAKVQSALLEAMQERQVTLGEQTWALPRPFLVLATQNPIEQEGTYPLPEAQVDRFTLKLRVAYPSAEEELEIIRRSGEGRPEIRPVVTLAELEGARALTRQVKVSEVLMRYIVGLVRATRAPGTVDRELERAIEVGASPRAGIALAATARAHAFLDGRGFALPEDVKAVALDVLRHRVLPTYEAEADGLDAEQLVRRILDKVDIR
ncbi:MAG: AAA family ATPase [Deltaproteobacteria bacterium]|nr:AAA family ATPase [Deltaproteobacteria bacterium]